MVQASREGCSDLPRDCTTSVGRRVWLVWQHLHSLFCVNITNPSIIYSDRNRSAAKILKVMSSAMYKYLINWIFDFALLVEHCKFKWFRGKSFWFLREMQTPLSGKLYFGGKAILRGQRFTASFPPLPDVPREKRDILTNKKWFSNHSIFFHMLDDLLQ